MSIQFNIPEVAKEINRLLSGKLAGDMRVQITDIEGDCHKYFDGIGSVADRLHGIENEQKLMGAAKDAADAIRASLHAAHGVAEADLPNTKEVAYILLRNFSGLAMESKFRQVEDDM